MFHKIVQQHSLCLYDKGISIILFSYCLLTLLFYSYFLSIHSLLILSLLVSMLSSWGATVQSAGGQSHVLSGSSIPTTTPSPLLQKCLLNHGILTRIRNCYLFRNSYTLRMTYTRFNSFFLIRHFSLPFMIKPTPSFSCTYASAALHKIRQTYSDLLLPSPFS